MNLTSQKAGEDVLATVVAKIRVKDKEALVRHASDVQGSLVESFESAVMEGVCNPESAPLDIGYEIIQKRVTEDGVFHVLSIDCRVSNPDGVISEARELYDSLWGDSNWSPADVREALYEILVASNANPSPADVGFAIVGLLDAEPEPEEEISTRRPKP